MCPLTSKGKKIKRNLVKEYGLKKGENVLYGLINSKKITGAEGSGKRKKRAKKKR